MKNSAIFVLVASALLTLSGCGQTGALYLPSDVPVATQEVTPDTDDPDAKAPEAP